MKKICFLILLGFSGLVMNAQDLDEIKEMYNKTQLKEAKAGIDKYLAVAKNANNGEAWYYKGRIYNAVSADKATAESDIYNLKNDAFEAFKKNQVLDSKDLWLKLEQYGSYLDLYAGFYDFGAKLFNAKNYDGAYMSFKKALDVENYTLDKKYTFDQVTLHTLDTALVLNTAVAASNARKIEEGVVYYKKLADANVSGKDYEGVYEYLVDYYSKKDDNASLKPILEKAKKLYPENSFWTNVELKTLSDKKDTVALYAKYDEMLVKDPNNYDLAYGYAAELYNSNIKKDPKVPAVIAQNEKLKSVLKIAIKADKGIDATVLMANVLFNSFADITNESILIKGNKPEDIKKKADLKAQANAKVDEAIPYADNAVKYFEAQPKMSTIQKANYKIMLDHLSEMYNAKGNKPKVAEYEAKNKAADKL
ncbi:MAG: hypothetical protein ABI402_14310 [Ferruginibacter sp.]